MRFRFRTKKLLALYTDETGADRYPPKIIDAFFEVMAAIGAARDERDLYALKGLHFEKLRGRRAGQRSLRLNVRWRLVVSLEDDAQGRYLLVHGISRHYH